MSTRRTPGSGGVEELPSGRWRVRVRLASGDRYQSSPVATEAEARAHLDAVLVELADGCAAATGSLTFRAWGEQWFQRRATDGLHRSVETERTLWNARVLSAPFVDYPLAQVTRGHVRAWVETFLRAPVTAVKREGDHVTRRTLDRTVARATVRRTLGLVCSCLQAAVDDEVIATNPAKEIRIASAASSDEGWTHLTADEVRAVTTSPAVPEWARLLYTVAIYSGMRKGELWGLCWRDVTLDGPRPEIVVRHSHRGPTKSGKVARIPLLEPARIALKRWKQICPANADGLVFPTLEGNRRLRNSDAGWSDVRTKDGVKPGHKRRAGITRRVRFHDLRHTCASHLIMGTWGTTWSLDEVRAFLRHSTVAMTSRYAHLSPDHLHRRAAGTRGPGGGPDASEGREAQEKTAAMHRDTVSKARRVVGPESGPAVAHGTARLADALVELTATTGAVVPGALVDALVDAVLAEPLAALAIVVRDATPERRTRLALDLAIAVRAVAAPATTPAARAGA